MILHWPDENDQFRRAFRTELDSFRLGYDTLKNRAEAGGILAAKGVRQGNTDTAAALLEVDHPEIAARLRSEENTAAFRTIDGLLAEAALHQSRNLTPLQTVRRLGAVSGAFAGNVVVTDALKQTALRKKVLMGLSEAFRCAPFFIGDDTQEDESGAVKEARAALQAARSDWADPANRSLQALGYTQAWFQLVEPAHALMGPLSQASLPDAIAVLDAMPSPLDAVLTLDCAGLDVETYAGWAGAVQHAPAAWDSTGWRGARARAPCGLALPLLLSRAEHRLSDAQDDKPGIVTPKDVASIIQAREDGALVAWRWCAMLIERADRAERDGRGSVANGAWRTALALAEAGGWQEFDSGDNQDALLLEAARRLASGRPVEKSALAALLPRTAEEFVNGQAGANLSRAALNLVGGLGPMFDGCPPYGLATRILAQELLGAKGPEHLHALWHDALVLREIAAGGVTRGSITNSTRNDHRAPADPLHLIIAMGLAAIERIENGADGDPAGLVREVEDMLGECAPWDMLGHDSLLKQLQRVKPQAL